MYQLSIPKAEQSLYEADVKMAEAKESIVHAKEMLLEGFISGENSGKSVSNVASGSTSPADTRQPLTFDPVLASTPQNSPPPIKKEVDLACSLFDNAFKDELSISLTEIQGTESSSSSQDKYNSFDTSLHEITEETSQCKHKATDDDSAIPVRTPRPKRHCTELTTSYAEDDLLR